MYRLTNLLINSNVRNFINQKDNFLRKVCTLKKQPFGQKFNQKHFFSSAIVNERKLQTEYAIENQDADQVFRILSTAYNEQSRIYELNILNALDNKDSTLINEKQGLLLLQCCGHAIVDKTFKARAELCNKVWKKLKDDGIISDIKHYNTYLQICIENKVELDFKKFLSEMECDPNQDTYNLLLECVCEVGDVQQAIEIVAVMKSKKYPADERVFDALVLGHSIRGGLKDAQIVLETMQTVHVPITSATHFAIIRGLSCHSDLNELLKALQAYPDVLNEQEIISILLSIGMNGNHKWLKQILDIVKPVRLSKQGIQQLSLLCIHLVHSGEPEAAFAIYKEFVNVSIDNNEGNYAFFLLMEMLQSRASSRVLIATAKELQSSELNPFALEKITGVALRKGFYEIAWELLENFTTFRPHYFWPFLLEAERQNREIGVLGVIEKMLDWNVEIDLDTLEYYCIPFCDITNPQLLITRLQNLGFTIKELLTPLLGCLLKKDRITAAQDLYKSYDVSVNAERLLSPLVKSWKSTGDAKNIVEVLEKFSKSALIPSDYLGHFLVRCLRLCEKPIDHEQFLELLKMMRKKRLAISTSAADSLFYRMKLRSHQTKLSTKILEAIDNLTDTSINSETSHSPHPRNMNIFELECHLIELQNKNMNTRGVMRRLIQKYASLGNEEKANKLRQQFNNAGYLETSGMKASLLYTYVTNNNIDGALNMYHEIKTTDPIFTIDSFKILDLAALLVKNDQFKRAVDIIDDETKDKVIQGGPGIIRNCWELIGSTEDEVQAHNLFNLLVEKGFCVPTNIILGPLVKIHLKKGNITRAIQVFADYAQRYKCTPLQVEVLNAVVEAKDNHLMEEVLSVISKVHGADAAKISLITVLAQNGLNKSLRKLILETENLNQQEIEKRCRRWVKENKLYPLQILATATYRLPKDVIDRVIIHECIMQIHSVNNDCESAVRFYQQLREKEEFVSKQLVDELLGVVSRCNYKMPESLTTKELS